MREPGKGRLEGTALSVPASGVASGNLGDVRGSDSESFRAQAGALPSKA